MSDRRAARDAKVLELLKIRTEIPETPVKIEKPRNVESKPVAEKSKPKAKAKSKFDKE